MDPELGKRLRGFRWKLAGMWVLIAALLLVMNGRFVLAQLDNDDALRHDMRLVVDSVAHETLDHVDGFLAPAEEAAQLVRGVIDQEELNLDSSELEILLIETVRSRASFDGAFVGSSDGSFTYVRRADDGLVIKRILTDPERVVTFTEVDENLVRGSETFDPEDQYDPRQRPWYQSAVADSARVWTAPYVYFSSKQPGVTFASPPLIAADGNTVVVGIDIRLEELSSFVDDRRPSEGASVFVVDASDGLVAHPAMAGQQLDEIQQATIFGDDVVAAVSALVVERDSEVTLDLELSDEFGEEASLTLVRQLERNNSWYVAVNAPEADFLATARAANRSALISGLVGSAIVFASLLGIGYLILRDYRRMLSEVDERTRNLERRTVERDRAEQKLSETVVNLRTSNTELEQYASAVTHELLTPIRAIGGYVEEAQRRLDMHSDETEVDERPPEESGVGTVLERVMVAHGQVSETVTHLLERAMATPTSIESVPISVDDVVAGIAHTHSEQLVGEKAVLDIPRPLGTVLLNEPTLRAAIQNLVENSLRYRHADRDPVIRLTSTTERNTLTLRIRDNGKGIPPEKHASIFNAFKRGDTMTKGVGIGLSTVRSMLSDHGATITANPSIELGAEFVIEMTAAIEAEPPGDVRDEQSATIDLVRSAAKDIGELEELPGVEVAP